MKLSVLKGRPAALIAAGGVLTIAIGGFAVAAIPNANGTISGCYASARGSNGTLRVIDAAKETCTAGETAISWNQQGQPGVPGPSGPPGSPGPTGPSGPAGVTNYEIVSVSDDNVPNNSSGQAIANCPAGKKAIGGSVDWAINVGSPTGSRISSTGVDGYGHNGAGNSNQLVVRAVCATVS